MGRDRAALRVARHAAGAWRRANQGGSARVTGGAASRVARKNRPVLSEVHDLGAVALVHTERASNLVDVLVGDASTGEDGETAGGVGDKLA